jgi:hypothetical protein
VTLIRPDTRAQRKAAAIAVGLPPLVAFVVLLVVVLDRIELAGVMMAHLFAGVAMLGPIATQFVENPQLLMIAPYGWAFAGSWVALVAMTRFGRVHWVVHALCSTAWTGLGLMIVLGALSAGPGASQ